MAVIRGPHLDRQGCQKRRPDRPGYADHRYPVSECCSRHPQLGKALRDNINQKRYRIRDVLAINLPFFISEADAIERAGQAVPPAYHDQTWLLDSTVLERELGIPRNSEEAYIVILNRHGKIVTRTHGAISEDKLTDIETILNKLEARDRKSNTVKESCRESPETRGWLRLTRHDSTPVNLDYLALPKWS